VALVVAFILGLLIGLALRPLLNSYVLWKVSQAYAATTDDEAAAGPSLVPDERRR
jgi:hypothetical protein